MNVRTIVAFVALAVLAAGCSKERIVKLGWDPPAVAAARYQVFIDDRMAQEIPPPPVDPSCQCLLVSVPVPPGTHVLKVVAFSADGSASIPATLTVE